MACILIVDDEIDIAKVVEYNLRQAGFDTQCAYDGETAIVLAQSRRPDLVLLDLMLPGISGIEVFKQFSRDPSMQNIPVIMLTAKTEEFDRVLGLELGAKDYVTKPFSMRELILRIKTALRKAAEPGKEDSSTLAVGAIRLEQESHQCFINDQEITLTALEFRLLATLMARRGRVQTREQLLQSVWNITCDIETRTIDTHINRLRDRLGPARDYIRTVRGVGYRMAGLDEVPDEQT